jgi:DNA-binding NarL/FixJ family response regulator
VVQAAQPARSRQSGSSEWRWVEVAPPLSEVARLGHKPQIDVVHEQVVGEASDAETALSQVVALHPDTTTRRLKSEFPELTVVMLTVHDATDKLVEAIKAGA